MADALKNQDDLKRLRKELEKSLNWGVAEDWHSSMFKELAEKIFERSQVMLSPATLKRFFGVVNHSGSPSITTLDALSQFVGFENWREFKVSKVDRFPAVSIQLPISSKSLYAMAGFFAALLAILLLANLRYTSPPTPRDLPFSSRVLTNTYPNSVIFDFDVGDLKTDDILIQQYWDESKTISIHREQQQATGIYYFPGYFRAKLVVEGEILKEHDLFLRSNGWLGTIEYEPVPKYFSPPTDRAYALSYPEELEQEIASSQEPLVMAYHYISDLGNVSGDDFQLHATIRNTFEEKWAVCQSSRLYLIGTGGAMIIPFSKIGCSSDNNVMLNDVYQSGKEHDLSAFGTDLQEFTEVELLVENKDVSVLINGKEVYTSRYEESMGQLVGLRFKFLGMGEVKEFSLRDQDGNQIAL